LSSSYSSAVTTLILYLVNALLTLWVMLWKVEDWLGTSNAGVRFTLFYFLDI
jgi:hypothetical protein